MSCVHALRGRHQAHQLGARTARLLREVGELRREAARLNQPSTFAKSAKAQRLAAAKERELAALHEAPASSAGQGLPRSWEERVMLAAKALQVGLLARTRTHARTRA